MAPGAATVSTPVVLNVYDLTPLNGYTYWVGLGVFHSGIEVYGMEYGFGAHDYPTSGVFEVEPKLCPGFSYRCSISLGCTSMLPFEFREFMESVASEYHGDTYHLFLKNCNNFTDDVCFKLMGKRIPRWVNRLAHLGAMCSCLLPEGMRIETIKEKAHYHGLLDDDSTSFSMISPLEPDCGGSDHDKCLLSPPSVAEVAFVKGVPR